MFVGMHSSVYVFGCDEVSARKFGGGFSLAKQKGPKKGRVLRRQHRIYIYLVLARQERVLSGTALTGSLVGWRSSCVSPTRVAWSYQNLRKDQLVFLESRNSFLFSDTDVVSWLSA